jgi:TolA-binding protein
VHRFDIAGKIYSSFRTRFPSHPQAPSALFMGGQCLVKQGELMILKAQENAAAKKKPYVMPASAREAYKDAVEAFVSLVENYKNIDNKDLLAQGLYWAGDISFRNGDFANAYIYLKRTTFEYPESKWARFARGMLLQNSQAFDVVNE